MKLSLWVEIRYFFGGSEWMYGLQPVVEAAFYYITFFGQAKRIQTKTDTYLK